MSNGAWHDWNNNPSNPYARSWFSTTHPQISICCIEGGTKTTDIRGKVITGANNISVHNGNYLSFYSAYGSYSDGEYEITVADGWHIKAVEFDFESSVDNNISVVLNGQAEVVSSSPGNIGHVSTTISNDDTYSVPFTVKKDMENGFAQTGNFYITIARDAGLMESYAALLIEAKTQLLGALKLANAVINVNSSQNLITSATQFSSPYTETHEGSTEALLDGNPTTFWHSEWTSGSVPNHTHYLQVDLIEPTYDDIALTFTRRSGAINDHITLWSVYGSNNPDAAAEDWEFLSYLYTPYTSNTETITSLPFGVGGYQYLRFYIDGTTTGRGYGHMSEFQLNPASLEVDPNVSYLGKAIQLGLVVGQHNLINQNDIGWTEYNTLLAAHNALLAKFVYAFEVDNMYFKTNSLTERTAAISYRGNLYNTYADEYTGDVVIPESVIFSGFTYGITTIDEYAFAACSGLTSVTIPNTITAIGNGAFYGCTNLTSVTVNQDTPLPITANTFTNCTNVTLHVPAGSKAAYQAAPYWQDFKEIIETGTDGSPIIVFADANVKAICVANWDTNGDGELSEAEAAAVTDLGEVFTGNEDIHTFHELSYFTGLTAIGDSAFANCGLQEVTIPANVTLIDKTAFKASGLTTITIPSGVTSIGASAFYGCTSLASVTIPESVTTIGMSAFSHCSSLPAITMPEGVTTIGISAFSYCSSLTYVSIPSTVTRLNDFTFMGCNNITTVKSYIKSPSTSLLLGPLTFTSTTRNNATLYVPKGSKATYESQMWWQNFKHIVEMGGDVNDDGEITLADKVALINWLLMQDDDAYDPLYDVNDDGVVDVRDALRILELIANPW